MAEEIEKLTQDEIIELIRLGDVDALRVAVWDKRIKVPEDLSNFKVSGFNEAGDSALHVAARSGQLKVVRYLIGGLQWEVDKEVVEGEEPKKEIKTWSFDATVKNDKGYTPLAIAKDSSNVVDRALKRIRHKESNRNYMIELLQVAEMPVGRARDHNLEMVMNRPIPKEALPKRKENFDVTPGDFHTYTGRQDAQGNTLDESALHLQVLEEVTKLRAKSNKERDAREDVKSEFLFKAETGELTKEDVQKYVNGGGLIDCTTNYKDPKNGGKNALHYAIEKGHPEAVKMLLEGIEVKSADENEPNDVVRLNFDVRAGELLAKALAKKPLNPKHKEIENFLKDPKTTFTQPTAMPLGAVGKSVHQPAVAVR